MQSSVHQRHRLQQPRSERHGRRGVMHVYLQESVERPDVRPLRLKLQRWQ